MDTSGPAGRLPRRAVGALAEPRALAQPPSAPNSPAAAPATAPSDAAKPTPPRPTMSEPWIPFGNLDYGLRIPVTVNDHNATGLIDSGAGLFVLDTAAAARFGIAATERTAIATGISGSAKLTISSPFKVSFAGLNMNVEKGVMMDLTVVSGLPFQVIISKDLFDFRWVDIDFDNKQVAFCAGFTRSLEGAPVPLHVGPKGSRSLDITLGDRPSIKAHFDLGAIMPLVVSAAYAQSIGLVEGLRTSTGVSGGVEGSRLFRIATLPALRIGPMGLRNVPVQIVDEWQSDQSAIVGLEALSYFGRMVTHYPGDFLIVYQAKTARAAFRKNRTGLYGMPAGEGRRVIHIAAGSPADAAGWREGDVYITVNGAPAATSDGRWKFGAPGTEVVFKMGDGTERKLVLATYY